MRLALGVKCEAALCLVAEENCSGEKSSLKVLTFVLKKNSINKCI